MQVVKRDGRIVDFDKTRIKNAITKAMSETIAGVDEDLASQIAESVYHDFTSKIKFMINTNEIHDLIEEKFGKEGFFKQNVNEIIKFLDDFCTNFAQKDFGVLTNSDRKVVR